jgi:predicted nucleotidyltransferase component of viral defense system
LASHKVSRLISQVAVLEILNLAHPEILHLIQIKGGAGLVLKFGLTNTRFTRDLDLAIPNRNEFLQILPNLTSYAWCGFSIEGYVIRDIYAPASIPTDQTVQRIDLQLKFLETRWLTTRIEITNNEVINLPQIYHPILHQEIISIFESLSLTTSGMFNLISAEFQVAQKLHAVTQIGSERGRDLFDIYLLKTRGDFDSNLTKDLFNQLVIKRNTHQAPNQIPATDALFASYQFATAGISAPDFNTALKVCNQLLK